MTRTLALFVALVASIVFLAPSRARAQSPFGDLGKKALGAAAEGGKKAAEEGKKAGKAELNKSVVNKVNAKLLAEGRKNQCSFKSDSDQLEPGCDAKAKRLADLLIDAKKTLTGAGFSGYRFMVMGHTDTSGDAAHNKELSQKRAAAMVRELVARGVPSGEIDAMGMGAEKPLVKPDNTPAKKAKNRRYEIQVKI